MPEPLFSRITQPPIRLPVPETFPKIADLPGPDFIEPVWLSQSINRMRHTATAFRTHAISQNNGQLPRDVLIAWPHKDPSINTNETTKPLSLFVHAAMRAHIPEINWHLADGLLEGKVLRRGAMQKDLSRRFSATQTYYFNPAAQMHAPPPRDDKNFFFVIDDFYSYGTSVADLVSFLRHNKHHVVMAGVIYCMSDHRYLQQAPTQRDELADMFARKAQKKFTPDQCLHWAEQALRRKRHSLAALTFDECGLVLEAMKYNGLTFRKFMEALGSPIPVRTDVPVKVPA